MFHLLRLYINTFCFKPMALALLGSFAWTLDREFRHKSANYGTSQVIFLFFFSSSFLFTFRLSERLKCIWRCVTVKVPCGPWANCVFVVMVKCRVI